MLAYILALAVGISSSILFTKAILNKELQRESKFWQTDIFWGAIGLFYALDLWLCAGRITGAVLLGQIASVSLIGWFGWQTLTMRRTLEQVASETVDKPKISATVEETGNNLPETKEKSGFSLSKVFKPVTNIFSKDKPQTEMTLGSVVEELEEVEEVLETVDTQIETVKDVVGDKKVTEETELATDSTGNEAETTESETELATDFTSDEEVEAKSAKDSTSDEVEATELETEIATDSTSDEVEPQLATDSTGNEAEATESETESATDSTSDEFEPQLATEFVEEKLATEFIEEEFETTPKDESETEIAATVIDEEIATKTTIEEEDKLEAYIDLADEYPIEKNITPPESKLPQTDKDSENPPAQT